MNNDSNNKECNNMQNTMFNSAVKIDKSEEIREVLTLVKSAMKERGYNPVNQIVGYILSGDPTYITSHKNVRTLIRKVERDEILEELLKNYLGE